ncbi:MAG TPA: glucose 1-dehydrogenase [Actinomycetota bacterium]|nr:glucose 1-dehydrogenase [Actinomycetota bacterium]
MERLDGKVAIVTGSGSGIGMLSAKLFAKEGAKVVVSDVVDDAGERVTDEIHGEGGEAAYQHADVSNAGEAEAMVRFAVDTFGGLHVMMNNAGIFHPQDDSVTNTPEDVWDKTLAINLKGVFLGCKFGIPAMLDSGGGSMINVASFVALVGAATPQIAYTASKGGVLSMTREIAVEFARRGIRVNAICPGPIETPLLAELLADPARRARRLVHIPIGRFGHAQEIANAALWLASDESSLMTGTALVVDGGITAAYVTPEE